MSVSKTRNMDKQEKWFMGYYPIAFEERKERTPDFPYIRSREQKGDNLFLFVYGSLRKGFPLAKKLDRALYMGPGISFSRVYQMFSLGDFPAVTHVGYANQGYDPTAPLAYMAGDIYVVNPDIILEIDQLEGNRHLYNRWTRRFFLLNHPERLKERVDLVLCGKDLARDGIDCYVYLSDAGTRTNQLIQEKGLKAIPPRDTGAVFWEDGTGHQGHQGLILAEDETR